jgi:hypothetical protein
MNAHGQGSLSIDVTARALRTLGALRVVGEGAGRIMRRAPLVSRIVRLFLGAAF